MLDRPRNLKLPIHRRKLDQPTPHPARRAMNRNSYRFVHHTRHASQLQFKPHSRTKTLSAIRKRQIVMSYIMNMLDRS
jgi:hypothetical protein